SRRPVGWTEGLLLGAFGYLGLLSIRNDIWWGWVTAPIVAASGAVLAQRVLAQLAPAPAAAPAGAEGLPAPSAPEIPVLNWMIAGGCLAAAIVVAPVWRAPARALDKTTPVAAGQWLRAQPPHGLLFNYMEWGGYLEWVLYPRQQLFIDGRFEARQPAVWDDYLAISAGKSDWQARLDKYQIGTLVLNRDFDAALIPLVQASPRWSQVYPPAAPADPAALVFYRR
ncbi:MAG TPA: hypothetical protein VKY74_06500, partial [Chloroflexia bacterium]|nr:hypothetical protein [Chloroflexia bacterium]